MAERRSRTTGRWRHWFGGERRKPPKTDTYQQENKHTHRNLTALISALEQSGALVYAGTDRHWLRVLDAPELLALLRASMVLSTLASRSNLSTGVWQRDLLPAISRYAEFVQLMPASEAHHHAHAGGLLAHTLEMLLAAITWRNGHLLPTGATIEQVDRERDVWTYVVFFAALLHDIAKPMADLRIQWRTAAVSEPVRWTPLAGSLTQITHGRQGAEYRVEFTPKASRDYSAHSRMAVTLLRQIAPESALILLAQTPAAVDQLIQFLSGQDKESLVAQIVRRADQASTRRALLRGSKARFATARSVPLIELMMGALKAMLRNGTELPLNRSGAAGWVYQGSLWLVAKRAADEVRTWLQQHAPDENIPGSTKNDRLFDTWQEYGTIEPNPQTGQAVWYVIIHGGEAGKDDAQHTYTHSLSMLRFPLSRLYDDPAHYPPEMTGTIEVKRATRTPVREEDEEPRANTGADSSKPDDTAAQDTDTDQVIDEKTAATTIKKPSFHKVKFDSKASQVRKTVPAATGSETQESAAKPGWNDEDWLIAPEDIRQATQKLHKMAEPAANERSKDPEPEQDDNYTHLDQIQPVRIARKLPQLPGHDAAPGSIRISPDAGQFLQWLLEGLSSGEIKYNQTGALVHFTAEGMALVSPIIFKVFAKQSGSHETASKRGLAVQRELIKANLHQSEAESGKGRSNIMRYEIIGRGQAVKGTLSAIVLSDPSMFLADVPPPNPALRLAGAQQLTH